MERGASPCLRCIRVSDPDACNDKSCWYWQQWFLESWERTRRQLGSALGQAQMPASGCEQKTESMQEV